MDMDINSCLMLGINLETPVGLGCAFDSEDLKDTGIELDSHITLLYAQGVVLEKEGMFDEIKRVLGEKVIEFMDYLRNEHDYKLLDFFALSSFENDSDYVVLKLKPEIEELYEMLTLINKGLKIHYDIATEFKNYTPHITLAELQPGTAKKYLDSEKLQLILEDSYFDFDDLILSQGTANDVEDRKQLYLTSFKAAQRYFRIEELKKELEELNK